MLPRSTASISLALGLLNACSNDHRSSEFTSLSNQPLTSFDDGDGDLTDPSGSTSPVTADTGVAGVTDTTPTSGPSQTTHAATFGTNTADTSESGTPCNDYMRTVKSVHPLVVLVIDRSGSMTANPTGYWDHDEDPNTPDVTHWRSLHDVVALVVEAHDGTHDFGAALCPSNAADGSYSIAACPVSVPIDVPVDSDNAVNILAVLPAADGNTIKGASPTTAAIVAATAELLDRPGDAPRHIVLVADGAASCQSNAPDATSLFEEYDADVEVAVAEAHAQGITTYVIGIEASNIATGALKDGIPDNIVVADTLATLATLGGTGSLHNTFSQIQLAAAFETILTATHSCTVQVDEVPDYPLELAISINSQPVPHVDACSGGPGWAWVGAYTIAFCGSACDDFNAYSEAYLYAFCGGE